MANFNIAGKAKEALDYVRRKGLRGMMKEVRENTKYVSGDGLGLSLTGGRGTVNSAYVDNTGAIDVAKWAATRKAVNRQMNSRSGGRAVTEGPKVKIGGKTYTDVGKAYEAADRISRSNEHRGKVAFALKRLGINFSGFSDNGGPISDAEKQDIQKKLGKYRMSETKEQYGRLLKNREDYDKQYMTWERKKIDDAMQAAKGRSDVRNAEGGPVGVSGVSVDMDGSRGHAVPQSFWDGRKNRTSASRGKVGDPMHYYTRDDSWKYNVSNTRGGIDAIRDRVEKSNWLWSADGRRARVQNRLVDAMNKYNDQQMNTLAGQIEALVELSSLGIAPEPPTQPYAPDATEVGPTVNNAMKTDEYWRTKAKQVVDEVTFNKFDYGF